MTCVKGTNTFLLKELSTPGQKKQSLQGNNVNHNQVLSLQSICLFSLPSYLVLLTLMSIMIKFLFIPCVKMRKKHILIIVMNQLSQMFILIGVNK